MTTAPPITFVHPDLSPDARLADFPTFRRSHDAWGVQVPLRLREAGVAVEISATVPERGIVVLHRDLLPEAIEPGAAHYLVVLRGDRRPHSRANAEVVFNPMAAVPAGGQRRCYMPMFPQSGLLPRDPARGDRFETILYMGAAENLAPEVQSASFGKFLAGLGLELRVELRPERWHDFSEADAILAVRPPGLDDLRKPANKLINAWHAGLPAILGPEAAFRQHRRSELDYLEAGSPEAIRAALTRLAQDPGLRRRMAENGRERAADFTAAAVVERWRRLLVEEIVPDAQDWFASPLRRRAFVLRRDLASARSISASPRGWLAYLRGRWSDRRQGRLELRPGAPPPAMPQ